MPYKRPGESQYVTNKTGGTLTHGQPFGNGKFVGVAVKQKAPSFADGMAVQNVIADNEEFLLIVKGVVQVTTISGLEVGDKVFITNENKLTETEGSNQKFGRVVEVAGERGTPAGAVRIDLDKKDSF
jgi:hypothetical protein